MMRGKMGSPIGKTSTRRQLLLGVGIAFCGLLADSEVWGKAQQQAIKETSSRAANTARRTSLHQQIDFKSSSPRIYQVLLDAKQFASFTRMPAEIDAKAGGAFSMFGGLIVGRNVELIPTKRIVQAWRPADWEPGIYSIVRFDLKPNGSETIVVLDHTSFPEGDFNELYTGWKSRYWDPLKKFLAESPG
jgi:activator of HSP90 ATPase